jgi:hypothetical protein
VLEHFALFTEAGIIVGLVASHQVHEESSPAFEGGAAYFAARIGREQPMEMIQAAGEWLTLGQHFIPLLLEDRFSRHNFLYRSLYAGRYTLLH